ncbi:hypothetical protein J2R78_008603 [Bradyrhizobium sp. USDA 4538]|nr:hypothetical protein [Bradyrhizobium sp. USDA 4538]MCP1907109.1 hypothetical protein [Bradyrhizobium sp. USDA 4537]MCP1985584.1 hypothetical protein [Bradyrhizobium sp. USDA 4539]
MSGSSMGSCWLMSPGWWQMWRHIRVPGALPLRFGLAVFVVAREQAHAEHERLLALARQRMCR